MHDFFKQVVDLLADLIYGSFCLTFQVLDFVLIRWKSIDNPYLKLGSLIVFGMVLVICYQRFLITRLRKLLRAQDLVCPFCGKAADPIPRTVNRYRCVDGHQFQGASHRH